VIETAVPYAAFKLAGFEVQFATENGKAPECDKKMLRGITQKLLVSSTSLRACHVYPSFCICLQLTIFQGATKPAVNAYDEMSKTTEFLQPVSWSFPDFSLDSYNLVFLPGGHEKGVRQVIDSPIIHKQLAQYFPATRKPSKKAVAAICHGVMVLSETLDADGKSIIHECDTTALPARFEQVAFWGTRAFLGDYYKTYGVGSDDVEVSVRSAWLSSR
jgi:putative intracellular protease/amidase